MPIVQCGNFKLHYVEEGRGFPVVLIHGLAGDWTAWKPYLAALKEQYRVVAFDNPGSGQSSAVTRPVQMAELAQATLALMDALGIECAHVVGRSMGGAIAQEMAFAAPKRVQSLAMAGSFAKLDALGERLIRNMRELLQWRKNWSEWAKVFSPSFVSPDFFNANRDRMAEIERLLSDEKRDQASYAHLAECVLQYDALERIGTLRCPTLIMAGRLDPICSKTSTGWMKERLPQAELVIFEQSSHFFLMEEAPKAIATLKDWLQRRTPA
jgi:3-oxoadipate enol-lactonase